MKKWYFWVIVIIVLFIVFCFYTNYKTELDNKEAMNKSVLPETEWLQIQADADTIFEVYDLHGAYGVAQLENYLAPLIKYNTYVGTAAKNEYITESKATETKSKSELIIKTINAIAK